MSARTAASALVLLAWALPSLAQEEFDETPRAFVELVAPDTACFVGEVVTVTVRVGYDEAFFRDRAVPLFRRTLDVPLQVECPWLAEPRGAVLVPGEVGEGPSFAFGDDVVRAHDATHVDTDGRRFALLSFDRRVRAVAPGPLTIPAPRIRYAFATRFVDDFVRGRVAQDRHVTELDGETLELDVSALPEEGRPAGFSGAVGRFGVAAQASTTQFAVGETFRLTLRIEGDGDPRIYEPPRLDALLPGLHLLGVLDDRGAPVRTVAYELAFEQGPERGIPAVAFTFFDPGPPAGYRTASADPIAAARTVASEDPTTAAPPSTASVPSEQPPPASGLHPALWVFGFLGLAALVVVSLRRHRHAPGPVMAPPLRVAAVTVFQDAAAGGADPGAALALALAAQLGCNPAAVVAPDLRRRLEADGIPPDLARDLAALLESLVAARYGGDEVPAGAETALRLLGALGDG